MSPMGRGRRLLKFRETAAAVLTLAACQAALSPAAIAQTATYPTPGPGDPRIKEFMYDPNAIVGIRGQLGYELTIEFGTDERIENVSIRTPRCRRARTSRSMNVCERLGYSVFRYAMVIDASSTFPRSS